MKEITYTAITAGIYQAAFAQDYFEYQQNSYYYDQPYDNWAYYEEQPYNEITYNFDYVDYTGGYMNDYNSKNIKFLNEEEFVADEYSEYNDLVAEYNDVLEQYNKIVTQFNEMLDDDSIHEQLVYDAYNDLLQNESYNEMAVAY